MRLRRPPDPRPIPEESECRSASEKVCNLGPMAARSVKNVNYPRAPSSRRGPVRTPYPTDSQLQVYDIYTMRRVLWADRDVNILIWTSKSVVDGTNDRNDVHGDGRTKADGRSWASSNYARIISRGWWTRLSE